MNLSCDSLVDAPARAIDQQRKSDGSVNRVTVESPPSHSRSRSVGPLQRLDRLRSDDLVGLFVDSLSSVTHKSPR